MSLTPSTISANYAATITIAGLVPSPTTYIAFYAGTISSCPTSSRVSVNLYNTNTSVTCANPALSVAARRSCWPLIPACPNRSRCRGRYRTTIVPLTTRGMYRLCLQSDGATWLPQLQPALFLQVIGPYLRAHRRPPF